MSQPCHYCSAPAEFLCDAPTSLAEEDAIVPARISGEALSTCPRPLCKSHRVVRGSGIACGRRGKGGKGHRSGCCQRFTIDWGLEGADAFEARKAKPYPPAEMTTPTPPEPEVTMSQSQEQQQLFDQIGERLAAPFDAAEIKFKPATVSGNRALALPYVDARVIQDRLDDVLGIFNWQDSYECLPDGSVVCRLKIRLGEEWITKEDVGGQSEQPDEGDRRKAAFSDALKRAAVKFGIGRYLYRQKPQWLDWDAQKRQFVRPPMLPVAAVPGPAAQQAQQAQQAVEAPASDEDRRRIQAELQRVGRTPAQLLAKLKLPEGARLTVSQARVALKLLADMPDMPDATPQKAGAAS